MVKVFFGKDYQREYRWLWGIVSRDFQIPYTEVDRKEHAEVVWGKGGYRFSGKFLKCYEKKDFTPEHIFGSESIISDNGEYDYIGTIFYFTNMLLEYQETRNRLHFKDSIFSRLNIQPDNIVKGLWKAWLEKDRVLSDFKDGSNRKSEVFISHDIDILNSGIRFEATHCLKNYDFGKALRLILIHYFKKPLWFNIDQILKLETEYDVKATYFWLVEKGEKEGILQSDYKIKNKRVKKAISNVSESGAFNGLHKSTLDQYYDKELKKLPFSTTYNRNHFLRVNFPEHLYNLSNSKIKLDTSLGFVDKIGFRNGYGYPVAPFDPIHEKEFSFLALPLHFMDTYLLKEDPIARQNMMIDFLDKNSTGAVLNTLWHNNYLTPNKYRDLLSLFQLFLQYIKENNMDAVTPDDILKNYSS